MESAMAGNSGLSAGVQSATSLTAAPVPAAMSRNHSFTNNGSKSQILCKVCAARFSPSESRFSCVKLRCLHSGNALVPKKDRKHFIVYKYVNPKCPYYLHNLNKVQLPDYGNLWRTENFLRMIPLAAKVLCPHRGSSLSGKPAGANDAGIRRVEREAYIIYTVRS